MGKLILLLSFSQGTPLHDSAYHGHLEVTRLLVESKADVAARNRCFSPPPSHHLSLTICLAAGAKLQSKAPSASTKPTSLHTCAASVLLNDAPPRAAAAQIKTVLVRVAAEHSIRSCPSNNGTALAHFVHSHALISFICPRAVCALAQSCKVVTIANCSHIQAPSRIIPCDATSAKSTRGSVIYELFI